MVKRLWQGADLHMAQLIRVPVPFIVACFSKIQIGFTFPGESPESHKMVVVVVVVGNKNVLLTYATKPHVVIIYEVVGSRFRKNNSINVFSYQCTYQFIFSFC